MIRGWAEVARMLGYYEPETKRLELNIEGQTHMNHLERLSDGELLRMIETARVEGQMVAAWS